MSALYFLLTLGHLHRIIFEYTFADIILPADPQKSLFLRRLIFLFYAQMRFLSDLTESTDPLQIPQFLTSYQRIIDTIHLAYHTQQNNHYDDWPVD
jgi:hypothetical protein